MYACGPGISPALSEFSLYSFHKGLARACDPQHPVRSGSAWVRTGMWFAVSPESLCRHQVASGRARISACSTSARDSLKYAGRYKMFLEGRRPFSGSSLKVLRGQCQRQNKGLDRLGDHIVYCTLVRLPMESIEYYVVPQSRRWSGTGAHLRARLIGADLDGGRGQCLLPLNLEPEMERQIERAHPGR